MLRSVPYAVPSGAYQLRVERHGQVTSFGGTKQEEAIPLAASGEISGLELAIEDKIVRVKKVAAKTEGPR